LKRLLVIPPSVVHDLETVEASIQKASLVYCGDLTLLSDVADRHPNVISQLDLNSKSIVKFYDQLDPDKLIFHIICDLNQLGEGYTESFSFKFGSYFEFQIRILIEEYLAIYSLFFHVLNEFDGDTIEVIVRKSNKERFGFRSSLDQMYFNVITCLTSQRFKHRIIGTRVDSTHIVSRSRKKQLFDFLKANRYFNLIAALILNLHLLGSMRFLRDSILIWKKRIMLIGPAYCWKYVIGENSELRFQAVLGSVLFPKAADEMVDRIIKRRFSESEIPHFDLSHQMQLVSGTIEYILLHHDRFSKMISRYEYAVGSIFCFPIESYVCHLFRHHEKAVVAWQHGEMALYPDKYSDSSEWQFTTHYLAYAEGVKRHYLRVSPFKDSEIKVVGYPGSLERTKLKKSADGINIAYATGKWFHGTVFQAEEDPDVRLYHSQSVLMEYFLELDKKGYTINLFPNNTPGQNGLINQHKIQHLISSESFARSLECYDLVILDCPSTTCIEVCRTSVPLFCLSGRASWYAEPLSLLKKRAVVCDSLDELILSLNNFLKNDVYEADVNDRDFVQLYGAECSGNESKKRADDFLNMMIG
jgi:hypothetical protein